MKRLTIAVALIAMLLVPAAAMAKEPAQASISGPGFKKTFKLQPGLSEYEFGNTAIGRLTFRSGFFPAALGQEPNPMLSGRPAGKLGPRYTIVWVVPMGPDLHGPNTHSVRQDIYPYARGGAVTYMKPDQAIFDMKTRGGWYRATGLKQTLVSLGLPARATKGSSHASLALLSIPGALILAGAALIYRRRNG
jgi:hypothetical protein